MARRRFRSLRLLYPVVGILIAPTGMGALLAASRTLGALARGSEDAALFLAGLGVYAAAYALDLLRFRPAYVLAHELTHALAAWLTGARVFSLVIRGESGHVDLSHVNAFSALAPYWLPLYALLVVGVYRLALWAGPPPRSQEAFLFFMGLTLSFHLCHTLQSIWSTRQSDLAHAGLPLSISAIVLLNSLVIVVALKCLFPRLVSFGAAVRGATDFTGAFWGAVAGSVRRGAAGFLP